MVSRHWKGVVKAGLADRYVEHLHAETFPKLADLPGFLRASILRREVSSGTEFQIVTEWQSLEAIRAFTGDAIEVAVVPASAQALMVEYDRTALHYEIASRFELPSTSHVST